MANGVWWEDRGAQLGAPQRVPARVPALALRPDETSAAASLDLCQLAPGERMLLAASVPRGLWAELCCRSNAEIRVFMPGFVSDTVQLQVRACFCVSFRTGAYSC